MKKTKRFYCDNVDCEYENQKVFVTKVEMKKEFEGGFVYWCDDCIKRDGKDFIKN